MGLTNDQIRDAVTRFFVERQHRPVEPASLVPVDDPTLLCTSAGMVSLRPPAIGIALPSIDSGALRHWNNQIHLL